MPNFKVNIFYSHPKGGWSETYYLAGVDRATADTRASQLAADRSLTVARPADTTFVRVADVDNPRQSEVYRPPNLGFYIGPVGDECDEPYQAALMRAFGVDPSFNRPLYIRGIADSFWQGDEPVLGATVWGQACINTWIPTLTNGDWSIRTRPRVTAGAKVFITAMQNIAGLHEILVTAPTGFLQDGDYVTFYNVKGLPRPLGMRRVVAVNNTSTAFTIIGLLPADFVFRLGAWFIIRAAWTYTPINLVQFIRTTHRDTGRPFGASRGRRRSVPF